MKAFVEVLSGIVRVGEDCDTYGKPYDYAATFSSTDGKTAVVKALVVSDGGGTMAHVRAAFDALKKLGLTPVWERFK